MIFLMLATAPLVDTGTVSSTHATYDGNALILSGHVQLEHGLGQMIAGEASLERQETGKDFPFSLIHLEKEVHLRLKNSSALHCGAADLDFAELTGHLSSSGTHPVVYSKALLQLKSKEADLKFSKSATEGKKIDYDIESLFANENVIINYAASFTLKAHHALYQNAQVTAYPEHPEGVCTLMHGEDRIEAESVDFDLPQNEIHMLNPKGTLVELLRGTPQGGQVAFNCNLLTWEQEKNKLTLQGAVTAVHSALGTLSTDDQLHILSDKKTLKTIRSTGKTTLSYQDPQDQTSRKLTCFGTLLLDQERLQARLTSSPEQLCYEEEKIHLYANEATIDYSQEGKQLQPVSLALKGNVRLLSNDPTKELYALASRLNYAPATRTLILAADPGKKVLFLDKAQNMRISAQEVHITRDPASNEDLVKGIGNVQLTFTNDEQNLLKTFFPNL
jgi:hypothetical protein